MANSGKQSGGDGIGSGGCCLRKANTLGNENGDVDAVSKKSVRPLVAVDLPTTGL